jgi:hypothetical protein
LRKLFIRFMMFYCRPSYSLGIWKHLDGSVLTQSSAMFVAADATRGIGFNRCHSWVSPALHSRGVRPYGAVGVAHSVMRARFNIIAC